MASLAETLFASASKTIESGTPDVAKAMKDAAEIGLRKEQMVQARQNVENQKALLAANKDKTSFAEINTMTKMTSPKMRAAYRKRIERIATERGTPYSPEFLDVMSGGDMDQSEVSKLYDSYQSELEDSMKQGKPTEGLAAAREQFAASAYGGSVENLIGLETQAKQQRLVAEAAAGKQRFREEKVLTDRETKATQRFTDFSTQLNKNVRAAFKPVNENQTGLNASMGILDRIETKIKAGTVTEEDTAQLNAAATPIVRALGEKGPLSDGDIKRIMGRAGIKGRIEDWVEANITGDIKIGKLNRFRALAKDANEALAKTKQDLAKQFEPQFNQPEFADRADELRRLSGIEAFMKGESPKAPKFNPEKIKVATKITNDLLSQGASIEGIITELKKTGMPDAQIKQVLQQVRGK